MDSYPQRPAVPKSEHGEPKVRVHAARECVKTQMSRNPMPLLTDAIDGSCCGPLKSEAENEAAKI